MLCLTFHESANGSISSIIWNVSLSWPEAQRGARAHAEKCPDGTGERERSYQAVLHLQAAPTREYGSLSMAFTVIKIVLAARSAALATKTKQCSSLDGRLRALQWEHSTSQVQPPVTLACLTCQQACTS